MLQDPGVVRKVTESSTEISSSLATVRAANEERHLTKGLRLRWFSQALSSEAALYQSLISLADQAIASATNFLTGIIIARACSKQEFGLYMLGCSLILFMMDLQTSLITTPYMVYSPRLEGRAHALYTGSTLIHQLTFCLMAMLGMIGGATAITLGVGPRGLGPIAWALVLVLALVMLREHARRVSFARLKFRTAFIFDLGIAVAQVCGLLVLARLGLLSASRAYWIVGLVCGIAVLGWLWSDRAFYHPQLKQSIYDLKKNWAFAKWVFASGVLWTLGMNLYPWLLATFYGTSAAGVWAACTGVVSVGNAALLGIQNLVGPKIAHKHASEGSRALRRSVFTISTVIAVPVSLLCLSLMFSGGHLVVYLYGHQYAGNGLVVAVLALNLLVTAVGFAFSRALFAMERAELDFWANGAAVLIMVTVGLWMVRHSGALGAAVGLLAANLAASIVRVGSFLRFSVSVSAARKEFFEP